MVTVCYCYLWAGSTQKLTRHLVSWSSIMTQRFLAVLDGTRDKESILILMLWWTTCLAGKTISSVLARFSWRWWFFIHVDISARQSEIRVETVVSSGGKDRNTETHSHIVRCPVVGLLDICSLFLQRGSRWELKRSLGCLSQYLHMSSRRPGVQDVLLFPSSPGTYTAGPSVPIRKTNE